MSTKIEIDHAGRMVLLNQLGGTPSTGHWVGGKGKCSERSPLVLFRGELGQPEVVVVSFAILQDSIAMALAQNIYA